jgi:DNA-directed RNA polymerase subunit beta'
MPKILNYERFCENLDEVTSLKTFGKKKFHPSGLFSEQIFGPVRNYTCQCGIYHGVSKSGGTCAECGVDVINSDSRRKTFAKIVIPIPVVNPLFYDLVVDLGGKTFKKAIDDLMRNDKSVLYLDDDGFFVSVGETEPEGIIDKWERAEAIKILVNGLATQMVEEGVPEWKLILDNIDNLLIDTIIVLPPDLRPTSKSSGETKQLMDKINRYYVQILTKKEIMRDTVINIQRDKALYYTYFKQLQKDVSELYTRILEKMAKKEGLIRGNILGKRIDFSGRAVITPDPTLQLEECKIPYIMALEIFKLQVAKRIIQLGKFKLLNKAIDFVDNCIDNKLPVLLKVCEEVTDGEYCILNRQPSLHRLGMLGFNIKVSLDKVIKIHPLVCPPFNADFDGDQMAVYIPISDEAKEEIINKILISENLSSPANESLTTTPSQDIILGIYYLTSTDFTKKTVKVNGQDLIVGRAEFNRQLPDDYPIVDEVVSEKQLLRILNDIKNKYPKEVIVEVLDAVKKTGFKFATLYGSTMSLQDFPIEGAKQIRDDIFSHTELRDQLIAFSDPALIEELRAKFKYSYMIESGARGSWDQVKQLILSRGFISNFDGEILPHPIKNSLIDGLTQEEFFYSTYGCRKGLLDVALNTGTSGYLSRKLIFTCANLQIDEDLEDCGTEDLLEVDVKNKRKARMLVNRWALNEEDKVLYKITKENYKDIIGKLIFIRSPILCKSPNICKKCYGDLYKILNSRFIGILAAQTLGERGTQLVLRTFHTSGSAVIKGQDDQDNADASMKQRDIIGDLAAVAELLHKFKGKTYTTIVNDLFDVYDKDIHHVHYECVVAQLMWRDYKKWRLIEGREKISPNYYSIQSVPNQESWILAMAFSNQKRSILQGILYEGRYSGVLDKILKGEKIT